MRPSGLVLQQGSDLCSAGKDFGAYMAEFEFIKAPVCAYANSLGLLVFGMFVYGGILSSIYIRTGSLIIPMILLLLTGGVVLTQVPAVASPVLVLVILGVPAGLTALVYYLYSR